MNTYERRCIHDYPTDLDLEKPPNPISLKEETVLTDHVDEL